MEYWLKNIFPSQILLEVCSVQFKWSDCGQQWCIRKECKYRANILPPLLCALLAKPQLCLDFLDRANLLDMVLIAVGRLALCCLWIFLTFLRVLATITRILCWNLGIFLSYVCCPLMQLIATIFLRSKWFLMHFIIFTLFPANPFTCHFYVQPSCRIVIYCYLLVWSLLLTCGWFLVLFPGSFYSLCIISELGWLTACTSQEEGIPYMSASHNDRFILCSFLTCF